AQYAEQSDELKGDAGIDDLRQNRARQVRQHEIILKRLESHPHAIGIVDQTQVRKKGFAQGLHQYRMRRVVSAAERRVHEDLAPRNRQSDDGAADQREGNIDGVFTGAGRGHELGAVDDRLMYLYMISELFAA